MWRTLYEAIISDTGSLVRSDAQARRHVGTMHSWVEATTCFQQSRILRVADVLNTVRPLTRRDKLLGLSNCYCKFRTKR